MSNAIIIKNMIREDHYKRAITIYKKNPAIFWVLKGLRKKLSIRKTVEYVKENMPEAKVSSSNLHTWKIDCDWVIRDNKIFRDFMLAVGIDPEENNKQEDKKHCRNYGKKRRQTQKEKNDKLEVEMKKAQVILAEMSNPDLSESEKWRLSERGRRQVDVINREVAEGGLPKTEGVLALYNINAQLLAKGKDIILEKLGTINVKHFSDLKALSDILDTAFKQNRLIDGQSTDNIAIGVNDIYDKIIQNADNGKNVNRNITIKNPEKD